MVADEDNVIRVQFGAQPAPPEAETPAPPLANDEKLGVFSDLIEKGTVLVTLDARVDGVTVPGHLSDQHRLGLNFCHLYGIPDFEYDGWGVRASLSFGGRDSYCDIPWGAVYMMRSHVENDVTLFPESIPREMLEPSPFAQGASEEE